MTAAEELTKRLEVLFAEARLGGVTEADICVLLQAALDRIEADREVLVDEA